MKKRIDWKKLIVSFVIVFLVAFIGSFLTRNVKTSWYESIKPGLTPPNYVFPIVWNILFLLIALSLYFAWKTGKKKKVVLELFAVNFILNVVWSLLFFELKNPLLAFIEIFFLLASILVLVVYLRKINKISSWMLVPYLIWVGFASVLNYLAI